MPAINQANEFAESRNQDENDSFDSLGFDSRCAALSALCKFLGLYNTAEDTPPRAMCHRVRFTFRCSIEAGAARSHPAVTNPTIALESGRPQRLH
jgi:hypothetical protein